MTPNLKDRTHRRKPYQSCWKQLEFRLSSAWPDEGASYTEESLYKAQTRSRPKSRGVYARIIQNDFRPEGRNRLERQKCKGGLSLLYHQAAQLKT